MEKIDFKKSLKHLYGASHKGVQFVNVYEMQFLMIDGKGDPNTSEDYQQAVEALFALSHAIKFLVKRGEWGVEYSVLPLESLWWVEDMKKFDINKKDDWLWTAMIMQPAIVTKTVVERATQRVRLKKDPVALSKIRFENFAEGACAQILHVGPFSEEGPTIERLHAAIKEDDREPRGKHHEIYLSDMTRAKPEKWKTVLRQPCTGTIEPPEE
jgi:hypothetical protein